MRSIILKHREWDDIAKKIRAEYANTPSIFLIREKMKEQLGFTVREHTHYNGNIEYVDTDDWRDYRSQIHLDFYSESAKTMFMLKYL